MLPHNHNTHFATCNLNKHAAYSGPLHACALGTIDFIHYLEPSTRFTTPGSNLPHRLTQNAHQVGYYLLLTHHSRLYLKSDTIYSHLLVHTSAHNGRLQTFIFAGSLATHTVVLDIYAYQHGYIQLAYMTTTLQCPNTPTSLRAEIDKTLRDLYT